MPSAPAPEDDSENKESISDEEKASETEESEFESESEYESESSEYESSEDEEDDGSTGHRRFKKDGDIADGVTAAVAFDTVVNADGVLGCPESCMLHGKCVPLGTNSSEFGCQCECGWSGPSCDVPSGYCGAFPSANATSVIYQSAPAATPTTWGAGNDSSAVDEYLAAVGDEEVRLAGLLHCLHELLRTVPARTAE